MSTNNIMTGGRPTEQIDADFDDPTKTMDLTWDGKQWRWTHDDWYQFLDITPDYLTEKCRAKGLNIDETLRAWKNMLHYVRKSRAPAVEENLGSKMWNQATGTEQELKYFENIPQELNRSIKEYHNTVDKEAEKTAYQQCQMKSNLTQLEVAERGLCHSNVLCRPPKIIDGLEVERTVYSDADYDRVEASTLPESDKDKYRRCRALEETCPKEFIAGTEYDISDFSYISNGGTGDCLFIAVHHYMHLCTQLGEAMGADEIYPMPGVDIGSAELEQNKLQTLDYKTLKDNAKILRNKVCDYYRDHPNYILFAGRSVKHELAILNMEGSIYTIPTYIKQYNDYVNSLAGNNPLGLEAIPPGTTKVLLSDMIRYAISIINLDTVKPEQEEALDNFTVAMYSNYITRMRQDSTYGGNAEISVLSKILQKNIFVVQLSPESDAGEVNLTTNMGARYAGSDDVMYIFHNAGVTGKGSLHYEVMFPLDSKYIDGSVLDASSLLDLDALSVVGSVESIEVDDEGLDLVRVFMSDQCGLDMDNEDEDVIVITLEGCLNEPDLDRGHAIKLYFNHGLQYVRNEAIFGVFHDTLFSTDTDIDRDTLFEALLPTSASDGIDVVTHNIIPYMNEPNRNIFHIQYMEWFNMLNSEQQEKLLRKLLDMAVSSVNPKTYDPSDPPDTYNQDAENRLILYTTATGTVQDIVANIVPFPNPDINETISVVHAMIKVRRSYEGILGETVQLEEDMLQQYKTHWNLDEEDEPNYNDDDDIEPTLEIMLIRQIAETLEGFIKADVSAELTQLVFSMRYHIVRVYSQMLPMITLICKKANTSAPPILIPTAENTTLYNLMDCVAVMEKYINVTHDPI